MVRITCNGGYYLLFDIVKKKNTYYLSLSDKKDNLPTLENYTPEVYVLARGGKYLEPEYILVIENHRDNKRYDLVNRFAEETIYYSDVSIISFGNPRTTIRLLRIPNKTRDLRKPIELVSMWSCSILNTNIDKGDIYLIYKSIKDIV